MPDDPVKTRLINEEVIAADESVVTVTAADIAQLEECASANARKRARLCAHRSVDDSLHEMLIVHHRGVYVRPHKHLGKAESVHVVSGAFDMVVFDEDGSVVRVVPMGEFQSGRCFYFRMSEPFYHTLLIRSEVLVFHETTSGPFRREETVFGPWSPEEKDIAHAQVYLADLEERVSAALAGRKAE